MAQSQIAKNASARRGNGLARALFASSIIFSAACGNTYVIKAPPAPPGAGTVAEAVTESYTPSDHALIMAQLEHELERNMKGLTPPGYPSPYFMSYTLRDIVKHELVASNGALYNRYGQRYRYGFAEVRVGNYTFDNSGDGGYEFSFDGPQFDFDLLSAPVDDTPLALRRAFWLLTDAKYKEAVSTYAAKKGKAIFAAPSKDKINSFSREKPVVSLTAPPAFDFDPEKWQTELRRATGVFADYPLIVRNEVQLQATLTNRYLINSEGTRIIDYSPLFSIYLTAQSRAEDGALLQYTSTFYGRSGNELPTGERLDSAVRKLSEELGSLVTAPVLQPYTGPALLSPEVTGVFFHEAIGHRLEGERQKNDKEGQTFSEKVGTEILPEFITITDDPSRKRYNDIPLNGYYLFDDEGVPAEPVTLVKNGVLRSFLMSRAPAKGFPQSNGHGRHSYYEDPMGRMGNLMIQSSKTADRQTLKRELMAEAKRQGKPFGLIIDRMTGGDTNTVRQSFQAFRGIPLLVYKVDPDTGAETLVRGVEIVGTPLVSVGKILLTGDDYSVFNGFCGAESGFVPVSTVAPSVLLSEVELQRSTAPKQKPPLIPAPKEAALAPR